MLDMPRPLMLPLLNVFLVCITSVAPLPSLQNALADVSPVSSAGSDDMPKDENKRSWSDMRAWGKRSADDSPSLPDKKSWRASAWGKRDSPLPDKKWRSAAWGKRDIAFPDKKWRSAAWGKRDIDFPDKKWRSAAWGKRDIGSLDKKWRSAAWGKRDIAFPDKKWRSAAWGKRDIAFPDKKWRSAAWGKRDIAFLDERLRSAAWGQKGSLRDKKWKTSAWGKRLDYPDKKWRANAWGKRDVEGSWDQENAENADKRWRASAWGKRDSMPEETDAQVAGSSAPFGKESMMKSLDNINYFPTSNLNTDSEWSSLLDEFGNEYIDVPLDTSRAKRKWDTQSDWGKRPSWSRSGITTWGKRSMEVIDLHKLKAALLRLKPALNSMSADD